MNKQFEDQLKVDRKKIHNAIVLQLPIEITTYTLPRNTELYIRSLLQIFLEECHQEYMYEYLNFSVGELLTNAKKANTKRVYFKEKNLDINNPDDYTKGMKSFKDDTLDNIDYYLNLQKEVGLYIKLVFHLFGDKIKIEIKNNSLLNQFERARIQEKLQNVGKYNDIQEVLTTILDQSEGAGLGIIIIILMLEKIGLSRENYKVLTTDTETITQIILPCNEQIYAALEGISYEYVNLQTSFPVLEQNYNRILSCFDGKTVNKEKLFELLHQEPTITFALLQESIKNNNQNISIKNIIDSLSDEQFISIFANQSNTFKIINETELNLNYWKHSHKAAFFAYNLAKNYLSDQSIFTVEELYTLTLINSTGLIVLSNPTQEQKDFVQDLCNQYELKDEIIKVFYDGTIHSYINLLLYKKAKLPQKVMNILLSYTGTKSLSEEDKECFDIMLFAELLEYYLEEKVEFYQINPSILDKFKVPTESQFKCLAEKLNNSYFVQFPISSNS